MKVDIAIPSMGESVTEAVISQILKASETFVKMDEEIVELETDKVNQVLYAPQAGRLHLTISEEDVVTIGQVIGHIDTAAEAPASTAVQEKSTEVKKEKSTEAKEGKPPEKKQEKKDLASTSQGSARFEKADFIRDISEGSTTVKHSQKPIERTTRKKMTKLRQTIAERLVEAKQTTAMLTTFNEVDMHAVMSLRSELKEAFIEKHDTKLGFMSFFISAVVQALKSYPAVNSFVEGKEIVYHNYYDIGIAIGTDRGLVVPVLRDCDQKDFAQMEQGIVDYAVKARKGGLQVSDLQGATFTITNGGVYGSLMSTPILNPPQSGILGMHSIQKRPVVINDTVVIRPMMYIALSYDHRVVDGKEAVSFLVKIKEEVENPGRLLLDI